MVRVLLSIYHLILVLCGDRMSSMKMKETSAAKMDPPAKFKSKYTNSLFD